MVCIQNQRTLAAHVHTAHVAHAVHLHHFLHTAVLFGQGNHRRNLFVFQFLNLHIQFLIAKFFAENLNETIGRSLERLFLLFCNLFLHMIRYICINSLEADVRILLF